MCMVCQVVYGTTSGILAVASSPLLLANTNQPASPQSESSVVALANLQELPKIVAGMSSPKIEKPKWYTDQLSAEKAKAAAQVAQQNTRKSATGQVVTYSISTAGTTSSNLSTFSQEVNQTLNDNRGWSRLGVTFQEVPSGGNFNLVLSQAELLPTFSSGCSAEWSCRVGSSVIINDDRWSGASTAWNSAGGSMRDYHHMVVNHEVGHWLGHGHLHCTGSGHTAPVMQQQSIDLEGCAFNAWPLDNEIWSTQLGIG
jgi:hypothetical protein